MNDDENPEQVPLNRDMAQANVIEAINRLETALVCLGPEGAQDWTAYRRLGSQLINLASFFEDLLEGEL